LGDGGRGDPWRRLGWQVELELVDEKPQLGFWVGVACEQDLASVCGRQMDIDHLDRGKFFERAARGQPGRQGVEAARESDLHAVGQESDEDVSFDPPLVLVEDRTDCEVAFEIAEGLFDGDELDVILPELGWIIVGEIGAQEITAFTPPDLSQLVAIEREGEVGALLVDLDIDKTPGGRRLGARRRASSAVLRA
jgi:hypothetical protein